MGPFPEPHFWLPNEMMPSAQEEFYMWYDETKLLYERHAMQYDFQKELLHYCEQDVEVLRKGAMSFREVFKEITNICPFSHSTTLPSASHLAFRYKYLEENALVNISDYGIYSKNVSSIGTAWLDYVQRGLGQEVFREVPVHSNTQFIMDVFCVVKSPNPFLDSLTNTTITYPCLLHLDFASCFYHGCPEHYCSGLNPLLGIMFESLYKKLQSKHRKMKEIGFTTICTFECDFWKIMEQRFSAAEIREIDECQGSIKPREAFFGISGRTNAICLFYESKPDKRLIYQDINSLYPHILTSCSFPIGPPEVITRFKNVDISNYFGLAKVKILPPRHLFHPVLPIRHKKKFLIFPLCYTCTMNMQKQDCQHNKQERIIVGTYTTVEIELALSKGYSILNVYKVWHWKRRSSAVFADFLKEFVTLKMKSSGFLAEMSQQDRREYLAEFNAHFCLDIKEEDVVKNGPYRTLAKLVLNGFWGKFAQSMNMSTTKLISKEADLICHLLDKTLNIEYIVDVHKNMLLLCYKNADQLAPIIKNLSLIIGIFTTSHARIHLLKHFYRLDQPKSILYCDTDLIIYINWPGDNQLPNGVFQGEMKDEIADAYPTGTVTDAFFSTGPKSYGLRVRFGNGEHKWNIKSKGITLNHENLKSISPEAIINMICKDRRKKIVVHRKTFKKCIKNCQHSHYVPEENFAFVVQ